jgi:hypothetical protein
MKYSNEQLDETERLAGLFFKPDKIAKIVGIDQLEFIDQIDNSSSDLSARYWKGRLIEESLQREAVLEMARGGSASAQVLAKQYLDELKTVT